MLDNIEDGEPEDNFPLLSTPTTKTKGKGKADSKASPAGVKQVTPKALAALTSSTRRGFAGNRYRLRKKPKTILTGDEETVAGEEEEIDNEEDPDFKMTGGAGRPA